MRSLALFLSMIGLTAACGKAPAPPPKAPAASTPAPAPAPQDPNLIKIVSSLP